jgi:hypothetical protein
MRGPALPLSLQRRMPRPWPHALPPPPPIRCGSATRRCVPAPPDFPSLVSCCSVPESRLLLPRLLCIFSDRQSPPLLIGSNAPSPAAARRARGFAKAKQPYRPGDVLAERQGFCPPVLHRAAPDKSGGFIPLAADVTPASACRPVPAHALLQSQGPCSLIFLVPC